MLAVKLAMAVVKIVTGPVTPKMQSGWPPNVAKNAPVIAVERITSTGPSCDMPLSLTVFSMVAENVIAGAIEVKTMNNVDASTLNLNPSVQSLQ